MDAIGWTSKANELEKVFSVKDPYQVLPENEMLRAAWETRRRVRCRQQPAEVIKEENAGYVKNEREAAQSGYSREQGKNKGNNRTGGSL